MTGFRKRIGESGCDFILGLTVQAGLTIVMESVEAYKVCQLRIEAVEKALSDAGGPSKQAVRGSKTPPPAASADDPEDDIPF